MQKKLVLAFLFFLLLVVVHHLYGEYALFHNGLELKLAYGAVGAAVLTLLLLWLYARKQGSGVLKVCQFLIIGGWGFGIGVYDGGYNHLVLNIMILNGADGVLRESMFVRPAPGDYLFEASGILQFVLAIPMVAYMLRVVEEDRVQRKERQRQAFIQQQRKQPPEKQKTAKQALTPAESE